MYSRDLQVYQRDQQELDILGEHSRLNLGNFARSNRLEGSPGGHCEHLALLMVANALHP